MANTIIVSVVIPCLNEDQNIVPLYYELITILEVFGKFEIIFVDDGSTDDTFEKIEAISDFDTRVKFVKFSRCFGLQNALKAGIDFSAGNCIITMDSDFQHPLFVIPQMMEKWNNGYKIVNAIRKHQQNIGLLKRVTSDAFYRLFNFLSDINLTEGASDFRLIDRKVADFIGSFQESDPFIRGLIPWTGFPQAFITYAPNNRRNGKTKFTYRKMFEMAASGLTAYSIKPLRFALLIGITCSIMAFIYGLIAIYLYFFSGKSMPGWTSIIASLLFLSGIQLVVLGILGEYIGKIFLNVKFRPAYIVDKTNISFSKAANAVL